MRRRSSTRSSMRPLVLLLVAASSSSLSIHQPPCCFSPPRLSSKTTSRLQPQPQPWVGGADGDGGPAHRRPVRLLLQQQQQQQQQRQEPTLDVRIRGATAEEAGAARRALLGHAMNPLFVSEARLLVAAAQFGGNDGDEEEQERVVGFGQIRPLPHEEDGGSMSSPPPSFWELASLFVDPDHRRRGVGTALIRELLRRHDEQQQQQHGDRGPGTVVLLTLAPTAPLYEPHGFQVVDDSSSEFQSLPRSVRLEHAAGRAVSWALGNELVCMARSNGGGAAAPDSRSETP